MKFKGKIEEKSGITLVSLIVTIIILLILVGVSLNLILGEDGVIKRAIISREIAEIALEEEKLKLAVQDALVYEKMNGSDVLTTSSLREAIKTQFMVDDVTILERENSWIYILSDGTKYCIFSNGVLSKVKSVEDIFDESGNIDGKLHIGDFIQNYSAGSWNTEKLKKITASGAQIEPNNVTHPSIDFQFGGFSETGSLDENAKSNYQENNYIRDELGNKITGWRLFDVANDGKTMTLISAGCPENYYHPGSFKAYITEYILTGNVNSYANAENLGLGSTYKPRDWSMYEDGIYAEAETATVLTKEKLDNWYAKYLNIQGANTYNVQTFQKVYGGKYESLIDNYSAYWLSTASNGTSLWFTSSRSRIVTGHVDDPFGIRILVTLSNDILLAEEKVGTRIVVDPRDSSNEWEYDVWNLVK